MCASLFFLFKLLYSCCRCLCKTPIPNEPKKVDDLNTKTCCDKFRMVLFTFAIIGIPIVFTLSNVMGNYKISENSVGLVNAPSGVQDLVIDIEPTISRLCLSIFSLMVVPLVYSLNQTINTAVTIDDLVDSMVDINSTLDRWPDLSVVLDSAYDFANITTNASAPLISELIGEFTRINTSVTNITGTNNDLIAHLDQITAANANILSLIGDTNASVYDIDLTIEEFIGSAHNSGIIPGIVDDLDALSRKPDGKFPDSSEFSDAADGETALQSGTYSGDASQITSLAHTLNDIYTNLSALPNYTLVSHSLVYLNDTIVDINSDDGILQVSLDIIANISGAVNLYPNVSDISNSLVTLETIVQEISLDPAIDVLQRLLNVFWTIPTVLVNVHDEVEKMKIFTELIASAKVFTNQLYTINSTIVTLPDDVLEFAIDYDDKTNVTKRMTDLDDALADILDANGTVSGWYILCIVRVSC